LTEANFKPVRVKHFSVRATLFFQKPKKGKLLQIVLFHIKYNKNYKKSNII